MLTIRISRDSYQAGHGFESLVQVVLKRTAVVLVASSVVACSQISEDRDQSITDRLFGFQLNSERRAIEKNADYAIVTPDRAFVSVSNPLLIFERASVGGVEQRIVLANDTVISGDNVLHIRAETSGALQPSTLNYAEFVSRFGGLPFPFEQLDTARLKSGQDPLGSYLFVSQEQGKGTVCVFGIRRIGVGARPLPSGTRALDITLRNCVRGTVERALMPLVVGGIAAESSFVEAEKDRLKPAYTRG